jgi:hypothetical protein
MTFPATTVTSPSSFNILPNPFNNAPSTSTNQPVMALPTPTVPTPSSTNPSQNPVMPTPQALAPWAFINQPPPLSQQPNTPNLLPSVPPAAPPLSNTIPPAEIPVEPLASNDSSAPVEEASGTLPDEKTAPVIIRGFDNSVIRNLNRRLEDPDWQKRAEAANDFSMILGANPNLERRAAYKPYVDAFMLKMLRDSSAVVHEPALRSIQVGYYRHPTQAVLEELNALKVGVGLFGLEPQMVTDALYALYTFQQQEQAEQQKAQQYPTVPPVTQP